MKQKLIIAAIALLMVIVGIAVYLYNSIDGIVESAIEKNGSRVFGSKVSVGSVDISLKSGQGTIRNVSIANPEGFSSEKMFNLEEIIVDIDVRSLNRDPIIIEQVTISAPSVLAEMNAQAQTNVEVAKSAIDRYRTASVPQEQKQDGGFEKRIIIKKFVFEVGTVDLDGTAVGIEAVDLELPLLRLNDVGGPHGDTPDGISKTVSRAFVNAVRDVVEDEVKQRATGKAKEVLSREAGKALGKIFNRKAANDSTR
jgi:hypothetical protein